MIYKIILHNKTKHNLFFKILNYSKGVDSDYNEIKVGDLKTGFCDSTIANLLIFDYNKIRKWEGTVPTNTNLEIFGSLCDLEVYLDNNKIPSVLIKDITCKSEICSKGGCYSYFVIGLIVFIILFFIIFYRNDLLKILKNYI